jgi:hypothetical protein
MTSLYYHFHIIHNDIYGIVFIIKLYKISSFFASPHIFQFVQIFPNYVTLHRIIPSLIFHSNSTRYYKLNQLFYFVL